mmetsp:Transcript_33423/g.81139  ORF Transcript_33423/g.81139 Transcript_33423/m.81139 type:complete len:84 (-) Transcript_33423:4-255(-)
MDEETKLKLIEEYRAGEQNRQPEEKLNKQNINGRQTQTTLGFGSGGTGDQEKKKEDSYAAIVWLILLAIACALAGCWSTRTGR